MLDCSSDMPLDNMCINGCGTRYSDIDALCIGCRRELKDKKKCAHCDTPFVGEKGWYVPSFTSYSDISYFCPSCIIKLNKEAKRKTLRLPVIEREIDKLYSKLKDDQSPIYKSEDGSDYEWGEDTVYGYKDLLEEIKNYEENEDTILAIRNVNQKIQNRIDELEDERDKCWRGSEFNVSANT